MAVEMKTRIEADLQVAVPVALLLKGPTLAQMTAHLIEQLDGTTLAAPPVSRQPTPERLLAQVEGLSEAEVDSLLRASLAGERNGSSRAELRDEVLDG
jgi:hypothetical protein